MYYAAAGYTEFHWVSRPDTQHSRNVAANPQISIAVFNSQLPHASPRMIQEALE